MKVGVLKTVELRDIWSREDTDFTNWLNDNLDTLSQSIGLDLGESETEYSCENSDFRVDIRTKTQNGKKVIIENQLTKTDHKHLGQIMTYMINMESDIIIWIAKEIRPEHIKVIEWLNESTDKDFYLIKLESYQIDDSKPAPFFKLICEPSPEMKKIGRQKKEENETKLLKEKFWESFLEKAKEKTDFFSKDKIHSWTQRYNKVGVLDIEIGCGINTDKTSVLVRFKPELREDFFKLKKTLESEIGFKLEEKDKRKSRGYVKSEKEGFLRWFDKGGYKSPLDEWDQIQDSLIDNFVKLERGLKKLLKELNSSKKVA